MNNTEENLIKQTDEKPNHAAAEQSIYDIKSMIYTVRNQQLMLDNDLAKLYQVETKRLNEAVKRNIARFPEEFRFQLNEEETESLRSQIATLNENDGRGKHRKYLPYVFTEQGIAMLSAVLSSDTAIQTSIVIMKSFVEMRHFMADNSLLFERISTIELKQLAYQKQTDKKLEQIFEFISEHEESNQKVFFDGQIYDAFSLLTSLIQKAEKEITLIDGYVDIGTLNLLANKNPSVSVTVYTHQQTKLTDIDITSFNSQYPDLIVKYTNAFHDRFLILDREIAYHVVASLKDAGKKAFAITLINDKNITEDILHRLILEA